ncbi:MAG: dihydrofolate reductase family protein [Acidimicrobiia bacterium]
MGKLIYSMSVSLDGYVEDPSGSIGFTTPDEEVHRRANDQTRETSAFLFGRRLYEVMEEPWRALAARDDLPDVQAEFARIYLETPRFVFSNTLESVPEGVQLVRSADSESVVRRLKEESEGFLGIGGPALAASLFDLIDEFRLNVVPVIIGGGKPFFPPGRQVDLELVEEHRFPSGTVYLRYQRAG